MLKFLLVAALSLGGVSAMAKGDGPCAKDREALCGAVEPGGGRIMKCMKENEEKLSPACQEHRVKMKEAMKDIHEACQDDMEKFCGDEEKGRARMKCMRKNKDQFSEACKQEIGKHKNKRG